MEEHTIHEENGGILKIFVGGDVERVNPVQFFTEGQIKKRISVMHVMLKKMPGVAQQIKEEDVCKAAEDGWDKEYKRITSVAVPENFLKLFSSTSKKEQVRLLKEQSITIDQWGALVFKAFTDFGYCYSQYRSDHLPKGTNIDGLPIVISTEDNKVKKTGDTDLSDGQLKHVVQERKVIVAKFFDKGSDWHCFFSTFKSLKGEESWKDGQAHFHYISDKFGVARDEVVSRIKSGDYVSTPIHIDLIEYGNQKAR
jgi:hypothetical protein